MDNGTGGVWAHYAILGRLGKPLPCILVALTSVVSETPIMMKISAKIRLYVPDDLLPGGTITLSKDQSHYVIRVMRQGVGDPAFVFNGHEGEWLALIDEASKSACRLTLQEQTRPQPSESKLWLVFAPIKKTRLDFLVEKAVELGASRLIPVLTERTDVGRVNVERLSATAMEAAEQCERLSIPGVDAPVDLKKMLAEWPADCQLFVMDETGLGVPVSQAFAKSSTDSGRPVAIFVGPEGGFSPTELDALRDLPFVTPVSLGPRVLRAETAALAALSCWQAFSGDGCEGRLR